MAMPVQSNQLLTAVEIIGTRGFEGMAEAMQIMLNEAMRVERDRYLQATPYERTPERRDYANGYKPKRVKTTLGELALSVPQVREGDFYPAFLERGLRSERALKLALAEMYIQGVSTRKVKVILEELCGLQVTSSEVSRATQVLDEDLSKWRTRPLGRFIYLYVDARYEKVREASIVRDCAVLIAYGIDTQGKRHILGTSTALSEAEVHWRDFLQSLVSRGLHGVTLIVSDAHAGLKAALKTVFPSIPWQRCQFHLQQNAQAYVPKKEMKAEVAEKIRAVFDAENRQEAERLLKHLMIHYEKTAPKLSQWLEENVPESLIIFQFPSAHRRRLRTSNLAERVNREIRRRTRVASIFPNTASCERLVSALLREISEEWETGNLYLTVETAT